MKCIATSLSTALLLVGLTGLQYSQPVQAQSDAGWIALFDGKSLDNWSQIGDANWKIEEGAAVADRGNGFLVS